ncbi:MAG: hypothetical protein E2O41_08295 [Nitrospina sp.]|nr:MAG: hypothetical protein E2O41_08295 [Nitrospina sp.]
MGLKNKTVYEIQKRFKTYLDATATGVAVFCGTRIAVFSGTRIAAFAAFTAFTAFATFTAHSIIARAGIFGNRVRKGGNRSGTGKGSNA